VLTPTQPCWECSPDSRSPPLQPQEVVETPTTGCLHPGYAGYFATPGDYMRWYEREGPVRDPSAPTGAPACSDGKQVHSAQDFPQHPLDLW
jgi:cobalamin biosynthesis Mg chelatase CobN